MATFSVRFLGCKVSHVDAHDVRERLLVDGHVERDENADVDFQAFVGRLKKAVAGHDVNTLASMMTTDFAYVLGATETEDRKGEGVFKYWDENGLWTELDAILTERFAKKGEFWVAPPQFADESLHYTGYRVGIRRFGGSWKFVYFVNG